ncbi:MAG: phosphomannomutase/phosphoglucomutase [Phycisphaeraceae bacterium]|nr:phosphomannomutase/phosphoglucomutase [Phycisphaeraceae bacterium]
MLGRVFKAYDIRGTYPDLLTDRMAWQVGVGTGRFLLEVAKAAGENTPMMRTVVVGRDMRESGPVLTEQLIDGLVRTGVSVIDLGLVDTPMIYFAINHLGCAGGVMVTASHNPPNWNGFKIAGPKAKPIGEATGLAEIRKHAAMADPRTIEAPSGRVELRDLWEPYARHVRHFVRAGGPAIKGRKLKVVVDASNAMAGTMLPHVFGARGELVEGALPGLELLTLNMDNASGHFAHPPNPLVKANMRMTQEAVVEHRADVGFCFDGDADRCMVVDDEGQIVGCDHLTALLALDALGRSPGSAIVYDLRSSKAVEEDVRKAGGKPVRGRVGHVFMKAAMAEHEAVFGGELSGHFYFQDNFNADSGAIAMATVLGLLGRQKKGLSQLVKPIARYVQSGELNYTNEDPRAVIEKLEEEIAGDEAIVDNLDGITIDCFQKDGWWINVRMSNTEPLLRLNAEAKDRQTLNRLVDRVGPLLGKRVEH